MIIAPAIAARLRAHGHYVISLPSLEPCSHCGTEDHIDIDYSYRSGDHTIRCLGCGSTGQSMVELRAAIERWNRDHLNNRWRKRRRGDLAGGEEMYP